MATELPYPIAVFGILWGLAWSGVLPGLSWWWITSPFWATALVYLVLGGSGFGLWTLFKRRRHARKQESSPDIGEQYLEHISRKFWDE